MKRTVLRVVEHDDGERRVIGDNGPDIATACYWSLKALREMADTPAGLRAIADQFLESFDAWLGISHKIPVSIIRREGKS